MYNQNETNKFLKNHLTPIKFQVKKTPIQRSTNTKEDSCIINQNKGFWGNGQFVNKRHAKRRNNVKDKFLIKNRKKIQKKLKSFMAFGDSLTYWFYGSIKKIVLNYLFSVMSHTSGHTN